MIEDNKRVCQFKMVYIRNKKVKGIDYAYLVQSIWDPKRNTSRQQTIKYLGKASQITIADIPVEYRNDSKIMTFISAFSSYQEEKKILVSKIHEQITTGIRISSQNKAVICTPDGELHGLACDMIESLLLSKGLKVYNISTSIPTEYIIDYIRDLEPEIFFISITLAENIKPADRLIQQIHLKYNNRLPVVIGGSAFSKIDENQESRINAFFMKNASFDDIMKLLKANVYTMK